MSIGPPRHADILHNRVSRQIGRPFALKAAEIMPKKPVLKMSSASIDDKQDLLTQQLCDLALEVAEQEDEADQGFAGKRLELTRLIRKNLHAKEDDILYEAIERARDTELAACELLKLNIEEAAETAIIRRGPEQTWEAHAFAIPLFARTTGGLIAEQDFQDQPAFELLTASLKQAKLESTKARVVLINHAYHLDEIDSITYSHLNEMVRESAAAMTDKKVTATPAIEKSLFGWPVSDFAADDTALELRFLLGFVLETPGDPFYTVPKDEAAAEDWFAARAQRFQAWSVDAAPLLQRCLVTDGRACDISFLYQDMFHGAKARGMAELALLQMLAQLDAGLLEAGTTGANASAVVGPADKDGNSVLRVNLHADAATPAFASAEKPFDLLGDLEMEIDDVCDALGTLGIATISIAAKFDADGAGLYVKRYTA